jgi:hypothetical protein
LGSLSAWGRLKQCVRYCAALRLPPPDNCPPSFGSLHWGAVGGHLKGTRFFLIIYICYVHTHVCVYVCMTARVTVGTPHRTPARRHDADTRSGAREPPRASEQRERASESSSPTLHCRSCPRRSYRVVPTNRCHRRILSRSLSLHTQSPLSLSLLPSASQPQFSMGFIATEITPCLGRLRQRHGDNTGGGGHPCSAGEGGGGHARARWLFSCRPRSLYRASLPKQGLE